MAIRTDTYQKIAKANAPPIKLKCNRSLSWHERVSVVSTITDICRIRKKWGGTAAGDSMVSIYEHAILVGLSHGAQDWWRDLPGVVDRYLSRFGCAGVTDE